MRNKFILLLERIRENNCFPDIPEMHFLLSIYFQSFITSWFWLPKTGSDYNRLSNFLQETTISFYQKQGICIKIRRRLLPLIWTELNEKLQALENIVSSCSSRNDAELFI